MTSRRLYVDIETYSEKDIKAGVYAYSADPSFEIMMAAYALDDGPCRVVVGQDNILAALGDLLLDDNVVKVAHNAQFERVCFSRILPNRVCSGHRGGWTRNERGRWVCGACGRPSKGTSGPFLPPEGWDDTMARAGIHGYPQGLKYLATALGAEDKDEAGTRLINLFCKPYRGKRMTAADKPDEWLDFLAYCHQDVETLRDVDARLGPWPTADERDIWVTDQIINDRGMLIDREMAVAAHAAGERNAVEGREELESLANVANANSVQQLIPALEKMGAELPNLRAETVEHWLAREDLSPDARRVLELRQDLALSASKKFAAALDCVSEGDRLRGAFRYFGAHTGRWAGRGLQPHNLPRAQLDSEAETEAAILDLKMGLGADAFTLKALIRALFVGPLTVVDYNAIEARIVAWLAGEQWALDAFAADRDIYVETAERMSTPTHKLDRSQGKVAVLALGYNGAAGSLEAMGARGTTRDLLRLVNQWRKANPNIVKLWAELDHAFKHGGPAGPILRVDIDGDDRLLQLPSGRAIAYRDVAYRGGRATFASPRRPGMRDDTYGGRLTENATQAVARDILGAALVRLERAGGLDVVGHVHDEVLIAGEQDLEKVYDIMTEPVPWAPGLPVKGDGFTCKRYRK